MATTTTATPGENNATASGSAPRAKRRFLLRPWLRAIHRDIGYLSVGFTLIYALSGLAVNHIADWDPNFTQIDRTHQLSAPPSGDDRAIARQVLGELRIEEAPQDVYRASESRLDLVLDRRTLHVDLKQGTVHEEGQTPRLFLRVANWLHLNRGKKAWSYVADTYAVFLLFLACSGLFMIPGKKGLRGRGTVLLLLGAAVPALYVVLSGGP